MFCAECGKQAHGKFCSHCGSPLEVPEQAELVADWSEVCYDAILKFPGVQDLIDRNARQAPKRMSGEQWLALADKIAPVGVPMETLATAMQPMLDKMGIKAGKERTAQIAAPVGQVLVRALCSLAKHGQTLRLVTQANDGCQLDAALPSDLLSLEGSLLVRVRRNGPRTEVSAATKITGQFFDWGKSNRCLDQLFSDLAREAA
jgi:hypothetical protein